MLIPQALGSTVRLRRQACRAALAGGTYLGPGQRPAERPVRVWGGRGIYTRLCRQSKLREVALVVAMRKLFLILNAAIRDQVPWQTEPLSTAIHS